MAKLLGEKVIKMDGDNEVEVDVSSLEGERKVVGIYFSAHWCPPCRCSESCLDWSSVDLLP